MSYVLRLTPSSFRPLSATEKSATVIASLRRRSNPVAIFSFSLNCKELIFTINSQNKLRAEWEAAH